jgi:hypothetical protein
MNDDQRSLGITLATVASRARSTGGLGFVSSKGLSRCC